MVIKNLKLKFFIYNNVFPVLSWINKVCSHDENKIFLYCNLSFRDNNRAVYDYLIENGYNEKYKIVVSSSDYKDYKSNAPRNVQFVGPLKAVITYFSSKYVFYCIGKLPIVPSKEQKVFHMEHGMYFKDASQGQMKYSTKSQHYTHVLATGDCFVPVQSRIFAVPESKVVITGNPKCDVMFLPNPHYDFGDYKKIILWAPTFRKSVSMNMQDTTKEQPIIPVVNIEDFEQLNSFLAEQNVKVVVKLHPEQDLSKYNLVDMDHFILLSHNEFLNRGMDLYRFMKQCDAMITDYSSIFFDYLLLNRPIGFTEDDIDDYKDKRGFAIDPEYYRPGHKIRNISDLKEFILDVVNERDIYEEQRVSVNMRINKDSTGNYCQKALQVVGITR